MKKISVTNGDVYGRLTILSEVKSTDKYRKMQVLCTCGVKKIVRLNDMRSGKTTSCGCFMVEQTTKKNTIHSLSHTSTYRAWWDMIARCHSEYHPAYKRYGGRGIEVCEKWKHSFVAFVSDVGFKPDDSECIDRIDNNRGYHPGNVRWTKFSENSNNTYRSMYWWVKGIRYDSRSDAAKANNVSPETIRGWCNGIKDYKTGKIYPPKQGCKSEKKYTTGA